MSETKERILDTALRLFARSGFDAVSVSEIAAELSITKGALYKHYKNKRDIFDSIVEKMYCIDAQRAEEYKVPEQRKSFAYIKQNRYANGVKIAAEMDNITADKLCNDSEPSCRG